MEEAAQIFTGREGASSSLRFSSAVNPQRIAILATAPQLLTARRAAGITRAEMVERLEVDDDALRDIESGKDALAEDVIAKYMGIVTGRLQDAGDTRAS